VVAEVEVVVATAVVVIAMETTVTTVGGITETTTIADPHECRMTEVIPSRRTERTAVSAVGTVDVAATVVAAVAVTVAVADNMTDTLVTDEETSRRTRETVAVPTTGEALWKRPPLLIGPQTRPVVMDGQLLKRPPLT